MPEDDALEFLAHASLDVEGQLVSASNTTLYMRAEHDGVTAAAVYKPVAGERPLWDFPDGTLAEREVAAFTVSQASGWDIVPPTVLRDGPFGRGMVQLWIDTDESKDIRGLLRRTPPECARIALFDAAINNTDRKGGHLLPDAQGRLWGIDHGVSFNVDDKLRTVIWHFAGDPIPDEHLQTLARLRTAVDGALGESLCKLLTVREVKRTRRRLEKLVVAGRYPEPSGDWPPVPWPPM